MMPWLSVGALLLVAFLGWNLFRRFGVDRIAAFNEKRRAGSRMVGRGEFVLPADAVARWHMMLPPRRAMEPIAIPQVVIA